MHSVSSLDISITQLAISLFLSIYLVHSKLDAAACRRFFYLHSKTPLKGSQNIYLKCKTLADYRRDAFHFIYTQCLPKLIQGAVGITLKLSLNN